MTPADLVAHRKQLGLTQAEMAEELGLGLRGYQKLEAGQSEVRRVHELAVSMISLERAVEVGNPMLAFAETRSFAVAFTEALFGNRKLEDKETLQAAAVFAREHMLQGAKMRRERASSNVSLIIGVKRLFVPVQVFDALHDTGQIHQVGQSEFYEVRK